VWEPLYGIAKHFYPVSSRFMNWVRASSFKLSKKNVFPHLSIYNAEPMAVSSITFRVSGIILSIAILVIFYVKGSEIRVVEELLYYSYITSYTDDVPQGPAFVQRKSFH
jgi:Succinate dehydrogenase/Fumarate reductase transmembrane subunit